ncbi:hypothetical protein [Neolewinella sp.]|uniref:HU domain-containing protein n=1 Tax=Neolewinella sp. TaxID=2993543 RepID=UPI003B52A342
MSHSTIEAALRTLLMEEGRVCLPGIGTLVVEAQPALVSLMEGRASPPSKYVSFNANLITDDGRLRQECGDPVAVTRYLQQIDATLREEKPFTLAGIGKLYRQDRHTIRFIPGATNLSKESYGLPTVEVHPIIRKERLGPAAAPAAASADRRRHRQVTANPATGRSAAGRPSPTWAWYLAAIVGTLLAVFLVFRLAGTIGLLLEDEPEPLTPNHTADGLVPPISAENIAPAPPPRLPPSTAAAATPVAENEAIIIIGLYGRERNVRKQVGRLEAAGYVPYTSREGRNTRVGLRLRYGDEAELQRVLDEVRARYTPEAFVSQVNGAERRPQ